MRDAHGARIVFIIALIFPCLLQATSAFKVDEEAYHYLDRLALNVTDKSSAFHNRFSQSGCGAEPEAGPGG